MTNLSLRRTFVPVALAALGLSTFAAGCDEDNPLAEAQADLCCTEFQVGAQFTPATFKAEGQAGIKFTAAMQSVVDLQGALTATLEDIATSCERMAVDLGVDPGAVTEVKSSARATAWCGQFVTKLSELKAQGTLTVALQPAQCSVNISAQANCNASCSADVNCQITPAEIQANCTGGEVVVKCEGSCQGSCRGSANLAVSCQGTCDGTCEGTCQGGCEGGTQTGAQCSGRCTGTCTGQCRGSCEVAANANVQCEGECSGGCMGTATAPKCTGKFTPPMGTCNADVDCSASCEASAQAKAECTPPAIVITASGGLNARAVASLEANLPNFFAAVEGRLKIVQNLSTQIVGNVSGALSASGPGLSVKAGACIVPAVAYLTSEFPAQLQAAVQASGSVSGAISIDRM
ncbi:MAG TPA: hypothetical protein VFS43_27260 [Polyangiaceae bacterium]|nr:hypothetical protein [Polyangiaceae bacterium]